MTDAESVELKSKGNNMRDSTRIHEICSLLEEIWGAVPNWRFGQLLSNLDLFNKRDSISFYQEDDETLQRLQRLREVAKKSKL